MNHSSCSKDMHRGEAQEPLRITPEFIKNSIYHIEKTDRNLGFNAPKKYEAAQRWVKAAENNEYIWLGISGAATPAGMGGLVADLAARGLVDVIVTTGANVFHDGHFAYGLPVWHGSDKVDDEKLRKEDITRIYNQLIHNRDTLKAQDMINQQIGRKIFPRLKQPFSTAELLYEFGKEMLHDSSGRVIDKEGSFLIRAAEYGVPVFLDSSSNHSLAMDFAALSLEGYKTDPSSSKDLLQSCALSLNTQPQLNVFLGEGGPRNFIQTTAPTASEIFCIPFEGSAGCIRFTTADARTGGLSGSTQSEAVTWGKYLDASPDREIEVWGEYTLTAPDVFGYVAGKCSREPKRLMRQVKTLEQELIVDIERHRGEREEMQREIEEKLRLRGAC